MTEEKNNCFVSVSERPNLVTLLAVLNVLSSSCSLLCESALNCVKHHHAYLNGTHIFTFFLNEIVLE